MRLAMLEFSAAVAMWPQCGAPHLEPTPDFAWLVGSLPGGAAAERYRWLRNGQPAESGRVPFAWVRDSGV